MDYSAKVLSSLQNNPHFIQALHIAKLCNKGKKIWLIGSSIYKSIIGSQKLSDFDFVVEELALDVRIDGWDYNRTGLGSPSYTKNDIQVDVIGLDQALNPHEKRTYTSTQDKIESYLRRVPLTVQSMVFDIDDEKIIGDVGLHALHHREIKINNIQETLDFCARRKISVVNFMQKKSKELGYSFVFPDFDDDNKKMTTEYYTRFTQNYQKRNMDYDSFTQMHFGDEIKQFISSLHGKKVIELGSGPGRDALLLEQIGCKVLCVDSSKEMVDTCLHKGLCAIQKDVEFLDLDEIFDGFFANTSLLHVPKKRIDNVFARLHELIADAGTGLVIFLEGVGEKIYEDKFGKRFYSYYTENELKEYLDRYFTIISFSRKIIGRMTYLCAILRYKNTEYKRK